MKEVVITKSKAMPSGFYIKLFCCMCFLYLIPGLWCNSKFVILLCGVGLIFILNCFLYFSQSRITVTNVRFYGRTITGMVFDLPVSDIKSTGTCPLKGVVFFTKQGRLIFVFVDNNIEIPERVSDFLVDKFR